MTLPVTATRGVVVFARRGPIGPPRALRRRRAVPPHPSHEPRRPHERVAAATRAPDSNGREARGTSLQIKRLLLSLAKCAAEAGVRGSKPLGATRAALTVPRAAPVARERAGARREHSPRPLKATAGAARRALEGSVKN